MDSDTRRSTETEVRMTRETVVPYGREGALALGGALLDTRADSSLAALVLEGEPGIGKSTVFDAIVQRAAAAGWTTRIARPADVEADLPFAALGDLVGDGPWPLDGPVQQALDVALQRADPTGPVSRLAVGRALLAIVGSAERTLIGIDDLQWIDEPTAAALAFAVRRLPPMARLLVTRRSGGGDPAGAAPTRLEVPAGRNIVIHTLEPVSLGVIERLVVDVLGVRLARPRLNELHQLSGGNPLIAIEIARAAGPELATGVTLPVPGGMAALLRPRLASLTPPARQALVVAAMAQDRSVDNLQRVLGDLDGVAAAVHDGVLVLAGDEVRPAHPLLGSVAAGQLTPWEARAVHTRLADGAAPDVHAHHLSRAHDEPDEAVAATLEAAAGRARRRGAPATGAGLAEAAARLSRPGDVAAAMRRWCLAAELHLVAGDPARARRVLDPLLDTSLPGPARARALLLMADATGDDMARSVELAHAAMAAAGDDQRLLAECHALLEVLTWLAGDVDACTRHCAAAVHHAEASGDDVLLAASIAEQCHLDVLVGRPLDEVALARALSIQERLGDEAMFVIRPSLVAAVVHTYRDELTLARGLLDAEATRAVALGEELARVEVLLRTVELELREGAWEDALDHSTELRELARQAGTEQEEVLALQTAALVLAHVGREVEAREAGEAALERAGAAGDRAVEARARGVLGFLALSQADLAAAVEVLDPAVEHLRSTGIAELSIHHVAQNALEAHALLGHADVARDLAGWIERCGQGAGRAWHAGVAGRGLALVTAGEGDLAEALRLAEAAVEAHAVLPQPFERARTVLVLGEVQRRAKRRAEARSSLSEALDSFVALGAPRWASRAAEELARVTGRSAEPAGGLSETERRVAMLAAAGRTNKEIAAELFVAVRTVEANLTRVYAKLGVRSRTELANRLAAG